MSVIVVAAIFVDCCTSRAGYTHGYDIFIEQSVDQADPTTEASILFTITTVWDLADGEILPEHISQTGSSAVGSWSVTRRSARSWLLRAAPSQSGTVVPVIHAGRVTSATGWNLESVSADNVVTYVGPCDMGACPSGYSCQQGLCVGIEGTACAANEGCVDVCIDGRCANRSPLGGSCDEDPDCDADLACSGHSVCLGTAGSTCSANEDCVDVCIENACSPTSVEWGACDEDADCWSPMLCLAGSCERWFAIGGSDFGSRRSSITWGSNQGGGISNDAGYSLDPAIALDNAGHPVVAWAAASLGEIYVARFDGDAWLPVGTGGTSGGGISNSAWYSYEPSIALDPSGNPVVAWSELTAGIFEVYVARFDGLRWQEVGVSSASGGGISDNSGSSEGPSIALDTSGNPVVAWADDTSGVDQIYVARFNGNAWQPVGAAGTSGGGVSDSAGISYAPSVALDSSNNPVVAWEDRTAGPEQIYVARFDGSNWQEVGVSGASGGGISNASTGAFSPSLALDASENPVVSWTDTSMGQYEVYVARFDGSDWQDVGVSSASGGGISDNTGNSLESSISVDGSDNPVVAWQDTSSGDGAIYVTRFDGSNWRPVGVSGASGGGVSNNAGFSHSPSISLDDSDNPVLAWTNRSSLNSEVFVARFDGYTWQQLGASTASEGGVSSDTGLSERPVIASDGAGHPTVAWQDNASDHYEIYVARFDGSSWQPVGVSGASGGGISNGAAGSFLPSVALDVSGNPLVAWHDGSSGNAEIYVASFDGSSWQPVGPSGASGGGVSNNPGESRSPSIAVDGLGYPVVAWFDVLSVSEIYVARFDGTSWQPVGASGTSGGGISNNSGDSIDPSLVLDSTDHPTVAWCDDSSGNEETYVAQFDGSSWQPVGVASASGGGVSNNAGSSTDPSIVMDESDHPIVAWVDDSSGNAEIYVARFDGSSWQSVGVSSATGGGVSNNAGSSTAPSLAVDGLGNPVVAWEDSTSDNYEIYVARYDGTSWVPLGISSNSAGGLSNSGADSRHPSLSVSSTHTCVTWMEDGKSSTQVLVRCTTP